MSTMVGKGRGKRLTDSERMEIIASRGPFQPII
ncbi:hypothetical protein PI124_g14614 [Phytophthora idaei]|nr:hypothetical protein PI125_g14605 [Phytophthora idaei]KAG3145713.1 hypothetical protein PI126_g13618 [Phytophthora idaei]KAG3240486.1 hypothetical protein PI124_g14614 [Phytophthora idaei]